MGRQGTFPTSGLMGVVNLSNEKPGTLRYADGVDAARRLADEYRGAGFGAVDLGAQSSHYAVRAMNAEEQIDLLCPVVEALVADGHAVAVETGLVAVVDACAHAGASCLNVSAGNRDDALAATAARHGLTCITSFTPRDSPKDVGEVDIDRDLRGAYLDGLADNVAHLRTVGVEQLIADAGIGYSYRMPYEEFSRYQVDTIRDTRRLADTLGLPTLVAVPRVDDEWQIAAFATLAMEYGASMLRCHDPQVGAIARLLGFTAQA